MLDRIEDAMTVTAKVTEEMVTKAGEIMTELFLQEENKESKLKIQYETARRKVQVLQILMTI